MSQSNGNAPKFGTRKNVKMIGRTDVAGGGQVVVENGYAFVGHMDPPYGTSIVDVKDPKHPKVIAEIEIPQGVHSHKVRVSGDIMLVNLERYRSKEKQPTGLKVYDIANREKPKEIAFFQTNGGVHRFTFDGRYAYISAHMAGYVGRIPMILDLKDPAHPREVGRWWMPGQWIGGGETPSWEGTAHQCHHPEDFQLDRKTAVASLLSRRPHRLLHLRGGFVRPSMGPINIKRQEKLAPVIFVVD